MQPTGRTPAPTPGQGPGKKEPVKEESKEVKGVKGIQSPKQPHVLIFPLNKAYPVKKVKNIIKPNKVQSVFL